MLARSFATIASSRSNEAFCAAPSRNVFGRRLLRVDPPSVIGDANQQRGMVFIPLLERLRRPSSVSQRQRLQQLWRNFAAVLRQLLYHFLVQPDVHRSRIILVAAIVQFGGKLLPRRQAAVHPDKLHQVDDRSPPIQFLRIFLGQVVQDSSYIHDWRRSRCSSCLCLWSAARSRCP